MHRSLEGSTGASIVPLSRKRSERLNPENSNLKRITKAGESLERCLAGADTAQGTCYSQVNQVDVP
ncbi:MAG: hypothetical protein HXS52_05715 [Theionarchaea archaeon]|nr:hypothetical protein [Theionarchaea archaeon]